MFLRFPVLFGISLTLVLISLVIHVRCEYSSLSGNETVHISSWESGRLKRSPPHSMPKQLKIKVKLDRGIEMDFTWTKTQQYVANKNLPVITLLTDILPNVMYNFGDFVMYQDVKKCSAVVYFRKINVLYGVIKTSYHIKALPYAFNERGEYQKGVAESPYIVKRTHTPLHIAMDLPFPLDLINSATSDSHPSTSNSEETGKRESGYYAGPCTKHQRTDQDLPERRTDASSVESTNYNKIIRRRDINQFFLETLVFVTHDIVQLFKKNSSQDRYIHNIIKYYITYFNALDMLFKNMQTKVKLHINIAKIVIEDEVMLPFNFLSKNYVDYSDINEKLPQFLTDHRQWFTPDSFDYVFIHTSRPIMDSQSNILGMTKRGGNMYEARKNDRFYHAVPVSVVQYQYNFADYYTEAYEIGQILNLKMNPQEYMGTSMKYCHDIMQRGGPRCDACLTWPTQSQNQFKMFLRKNPNRCFLLNAPRSLKPPKPSRFSTPHRQCQCFGYDSYIMYDSGRSEKTVKFYGCNQPLQCLKSHGPQSQIELSILPFDGTPCTEKKVCWNQQCVAV